MNIEHVTLAIQDLGRDNTNALWVADALVRVRGVARVSVQPAQGTAHVQYDPGQARPTDLVRAVKEAGFKLVEPALALASSSQPLPTPGSA